jgi:hypothetical protein
VIPKRSDDSAGGQLAAHQQHLEEVLRRNDLEPEREMKEPWNFPNKTSVKRSHWMNINAFLEFPTSSEYLVFGSNSESLF